MHQLISTMKDTPGIGCLPGVFVALCPLLLLICNKIWSIFEWRSSTLSRIFFNPSWTICKTSAKRKSFETCRLKDGEFCQDEISIWNIRGISPKQLWDGLHSRQFLIYSDLWKMWGAIDFALWFHWGCRWWFPTCYIHRWSMYECLSQLIVTATHLLRSAMSFSISSATFLVAASLASPFPDMTLLIMTIMSLLTRSWSFWTSSPTAVAS